MTGIGIIGAGSFGAVHARAIGEIDGLELVAASAGRPETASAFAAQWGGAAYADYRQLLDDRRVAAVVIATPHGLHEEIAVAAARAGKHILLEKPMAATAAGCDAINAAAASAGVHLLVGHTMHFALPCLRAKEIIASGAIGRPVVGSSWMSKLWMESNRRPWHLEAASGGGMLMTAGVHALDRLMWLMDDRVVGVQALVGAKFHDQPIDDTALIGLSFAQGGVGQVQSIGYSDGAARAASSLVCEDGTLEIDMAGGVRIGRGREWTAVPGSSEPDWAFEALKREWRALLAAMRGEAPLPVSGTYARHVVAVIEATMRASTERREVTVAS